jgi:hypothetical protein
VSLQLFGQWYFSSILFYLLQDLEALSVLVGDKPFFHGAAPTSVDCAIFGHLAQFLYIDIGFPQKERSQSKL